MAAHPDAVPAPASGSRIASIDIIRGGVMVLMAIDHVRVYSGLPAGGPTPGIFFTRWVTHFCAPAFVFLAGTSAFLYGRRHQDLARFLITRGAWLILLEMTVIRASWTFNLDYAHYLLVGVIWVIGWCMILLAVLTRLPVTAVGVFGLLIIAGHNLLDGYAGALSQTLGGGAHAALWKILYIGFWAGPISLGASGPNLFVLYSIIPWVGVIAAGYGFGRIITAEPERRNRLCLQIGLGATALFLVLRGFNLYGDPSRWGGPAPEGRPAMPRLLSFLNTSKYPASLDFLLMTLGPTIALVPLLARARGAVARWLTVFGTVPFFFYLLHIPLIHSLAIVVTVLRQGHLDPWLFTNHPMGNPPPPAGYPWTLWQLYATWLVAILLLYPACAWFAEVKSRRSEAWLKYL